MTAQRKRLKPERKLLLRDLKEKWEISTKMYGGECEGGKTKSLERRVEGGRRKRMWDWARGPGVKQK